jgi:hypothetical protein
LGFSLVVFDYEGGKRWLLIERFEESPAWQRFKKEAETQNQKLETRDWIDGLVPSP